MLAPSLQRAPGLPGKAWVYGAAARVLPRRLVHLPHTGCMQILPPDRPRERAHPPARSPAARA